MDDWGMLVKMFLEGLGNDLLIVSLSAIFPLMVGIGLTTLLHFTRRTPVPKIFRYLAIFTEGLAPTVILLICYFEILLNAPGVVGAVVALSVCFAGYMVFRYDERDSLLKNILVNGIGLVADLFKWSFSILGYVAIVDITRAANLYRCTTYSMWTPFLLLLVITFAILAFLYLVRQICKDVIK